MFDYLEETDATFWANTVLSQAPESNTRLSNDIYFVTNHAEFGSSITTHANPQAATDLGSLFLSESIKSKLPSFMDQAAILSKKMSIMVVASPLFDLQTSTFKNHPSKMEWSNNIIRMLIAESVAIPELPVSRALFERNYAFSRFATPDLHFFLENLGNTNSSIFGSSIFGSSTFDSDVVLSWRDAKAMLRAYALTNDHRIRDFVFQIEKFEEDFDQEDHQEAIIVKNALTLYLDFMSSNREFSSPALSIDDDGSISVAWPSDQATSEAIILAYSGEPTVKIYLYKHQEGKLPLIEIETVPPNKVLTWAKDMGVEGWFLK